MPATAAAWARGDVGADSVDLLARVAGSGRGDLFARDERTLVGFCATLSHRQASKAVRYWRGRADRVVAASKQRTFRGTLRRAIQVRDRHCRHPSGCDAPIVECDVNHVRAYAEGGVTDERGGDLECEPHNRKSDLHHRAPADVIAAARWHREQETLIRDRLEALITDQANRPPPSAA